MDNAALKSSSQRTQKWDILKFFLIFTVVLGHAADYYTGSFEHIRSLVFFIYIFHMPVFIFVSGLFAKRTVNEKRFDKMLGYILIYLILKLYIYVFKFALGRNPVFNVFVESGMPWFMLALFAFNLLTVVLKKAPPAAVLAVNILLACVIGYFPSVRDFLALSRIIVFYPFFYLGYCLDRSRVESFCNSKNKKIAVALILVAAAILVFAVGDNMYELRYLMTGRNPYNKLGEFEAWGFVLRLLYYLVAGVVGASVIIIAPNKTPFGLCAKYGRRTLAVYGLHYGGLYILYDMLGLKQFLAELIGRYSEWSIIPVSIFITLFFSIEFFNKGLTFLMNLPAVILRKIKKRRRLG